MEEDLTTKVSEEMDKTNDNIVNSGALKKPLVSN